MVDLGKYRYLYIKFLVLGFAIHSNSSFCRTLPPSLIRQHGQAEASQTLKRFMLSATTNESLLHCNSIGVCWLCPAAARGIRGKLWQRSLSPAPPWQSALRRA